MTSHLCNNVVTYTLTQLFLLKSDFLSVQKKKEKWLYWDKINGKDMRVSQLQRESAWIAWNLKVPNPNTCGGSGSVERFWSHSHGWGEKSLLPVAHFQVPRQALKLWPPLGSYTINVSLSTRHMSHVTTLSTSSTKPNKKPSNVFLFAHSTVIHTVFKATTNQNFSPGAKTQINPTLTTKQQNKKKKKAQPMLTYAL